MDKRLMKVRQPILLKPFTAGKRVLTTFAAMFGIPRQQPSTVVSDDVMDNSTAPTTPEGSLTFSPVLQALKLQDALEDAVSQKDDLRAGSMSLNATLYTASPQVKKICCVGAGYVGGPTAAVMAFSNPSIQVTVVDRDPNRIQQWKTKHLPIYEPGLTEVVRIARDGTRACAFRNESSKAELDNMSSTTSASSECNSQCGEHLAEELFIGARPPNLFFSTEVSKTISEADIILIAVNTPTKSRGIGAGRATDVGALEAVTREVAIHAKRGAIVVEKSTVPCRTAELIQDTLNVNRPGLHFEVLSNPEFLAAGTAVNDLLNPDRVLIGSSRTPSGRQAAELLASVYAAWVPRSRIITTNVWSSELSKLVANSMLAQRVSSINSISAICEKTGADINEVAYSIGLDPRIGSQFLKAGLGFGGSCFKKDVLSLVYLAESLGLEEVAEYWQQVLKINDFQRTRFVRRVVKCLNGTLVGKKLAVLGYAFKKNTDDTRESPALEMIKALLEDGPAEIAVFDPCCEPAVIKAEIKRLIDRDEPVLKEDGGPVEVYAEPYAACADTHAILIATECDEFRNNTPLKTSGNSALRPMLADPRPFPMLEPPEASLLALHKYLVSSGPTISRDPLQRYQAQPECEVCCAQCASEEIKRDVRKGGKGNGVRGEQLDWQRICYGMRKPKWIFDGRNVVDADAMKELGVRVESIGRVGWAGL
ncbi:hypothetical protein BP5796_05139 [Coleophoma crateriformis]|uniref:UDP-glucose 6-dehydrogenase n=1 Tax=Coleophoma crateriformis TaxID=565419 RepID=A0A3D8S2W6_9HELO|nr:hypothetical protein BP5796_05139 [Coleophoma crateriformis]